MRSFRQKALIKVLAILLAAFALPTSLVSAQGIDSQAVAAQAASNSLNSSAQATASQTPAPATTTAATTTAAPTTASPLYFHQDGTFKIMVISDIQDGARVSPYTLQLITLALDAEHPDLVVINGDNIFDLSPSLLFSSGNIKASIESFLQPLVSRKIPFAVTFGNHDGAMVMGKEQQWDFYQTFPGALGSMNKIDDRVGNYNVIIQGTNGKPALNLWFFDSGGTSLPSKADKMLDGQIEWYKSTSNSLKAANGGVAVPSVVFQHVPVPQIYDLLTEVDKSTPGAKPGTDDHSGKYYVPNNSLVTSGELGEGPCTLVNDQQEFAAWQQQGDVMAAVFGHDHSNDFCGNLQGIDLMYESSVGFYMYGNGYRHGVRVMEFNEKNVHNYQTRMLFYDDLTDQAIPANLQFDGAFAHGDIYIYYAVAGLLAAVLIVMAVVIVVKVRHRRRLKRQPPGKPTG